MAEVKQVSQKDKDAALAKHAEPKSKVGPHGFDSHIVVPDNGHQTGAVPVKGVPGIRVLPDGKHGLVNGPK